MLPRGDGPSLKLGTTLPISLLVEDLADLEDSSPCTGSIPPAPCGARNKVFHMSGWDGMEIGERGRYRRGEVSREYTNSGQLEWLPLLLDPKYFPGALLIPVSIVVIRAAVRHVPCFAAAYFLQVNSFVTTRPAALS